VKTAVEYIIRGSSTHVKKTTKIRKYASWIGRKIQVVTQKKEAAELDRNDPSFTVPKKTLSKPVEAANSATTLFSGRISKRSYGCTRRQATRDGDREF